MLHREAFSVRHAVSVFVVTGLLVAAVALVKAAIAVAELRPAATPTLVADNVRVNTSLNVNQAVWDIRAAGAKCDGVTDDTAALVAAIGSASAAGGGGVFVPATSTGCLIGSQVTLPNNGSSVPAQNAVRIFGAARHGQGRGATPSSGSTLIVTANPATCGQICTFGQGQLEIDHLNLYDTGGATAPMIYTTNTSLHVHDVYAEGNTSQDFIVLGGSGSSAGSGATAPFQGYGTVIEANEMDAMRRFVLFQTYADAVQVVNNSVRANAGGNACIDIAASAAGFASGNVVANNYIEDNGYTYAIRVGTSGIASSNYLAGNVFFDGSAGSTLAHYRFETTASYNQIVDSDPDTGSIPTISDASSPSTQTLLSGGQGVTNQLQGPITDKGAVTWNSNTMTSVAGGTVMQFSTSASGSDAFIQVATLNGHSITIAQRSAGQAELDASGSAVLQSGAGSAVELGPADTVTYKLTANGHPVWVAPALTTGNLGSCGSSPAPAVSAVDSGGAFTTGGGATGCTLTFAHSWGTTPTCSAWVPGTNVGVSCTPAATTLTCSGLSASTTYDFSCFCVGSSCT